MNFLVVVAHPDDEVLGAGATIKKLTSEGNIVDVCIMCSTVTARSFRPSDDELGTDLESSSQMLGIRNLYRGSFPNIEMNTSSHLSLVQYIEKCISSSDCDIIITHHPADTNNDHLQTSIACQAALRLFQRREGIKPLKEFWFMEVLSSTEWSVNTSLNRFQPNSFMEVGEENINIKIKALSIYRDVMRPYPHPRSVESIRGLAAFRGVQAGCNYAEAFEVTFRRL